MKDDQYYLKKAVKLSDAKKPRFNFAALIVKDGKIIAADTEHVYDHHDPSAHDGISALRSAGKKAGDWRLEGCTMYCSDEPCVMCFCCAAWAGIERIVYARPKPVKHGYEFNGVSLEDLAASLQRPMKVQRISLE
ncbi:MAG TPA: nucleoside deaminase [Candidatus Limnocylindrales bacterium]|nr:nucleoside deaminase [Candidatus Limnocylindrales bacterium]